jgi:hypothetical protein
MIKHVAPRCVSVVSHRKGTSFVQQLTLDNVLGVDLSDDKRSEWTLLVDLLVGKRIIAGCYDNPWEAGADFGKLRILLGLPGWPEELQHVGGCAAAFDSSAGRPKAYALAVICIVAAVMGFLAIGSIG